MLYLSVDFGTSAVKMSVLDEYLDIKCWSKGEYRYIILPGEKNELSPESLWKAFYKAADGLDPEWKKKVECFCYDTFSPSPVFLDKEGNLVYPNIITHLDRRSRAQSRFIDETFGRDAYMEISGIYPFPGGCSAMTFLWFQQNMPEILEKTYAVGHLPTYLHKQLTGEWMVDLVNASMMGMYETTSQGTWSDLLCCEFGLRRDMFGEIYPPGVIRGALCKEISDRLGVPAGIPVCVGTNDMASSQMGAGNRSAGDIMVTTGSSEMVSILIDEPRVNPNYYLRNAALPGLWQVYVTTCGGFGVDWFYEQFCREMTKEEFFKYEAQQIEAYLESGSQEVSFAPYLTGDRQSMEKKAGAWNGLSLATTRGQMLTAYLVAIQDVIVGAIDRAAAFTTLRQPIKISGGMITESYLKLKHKAFHGMALQVVDDCAILGNVELAKYYEKAAQ